MLVAETERRTVWVVDDSPLDVQRAVGALSADYEVITFQEGASVVERLTAGQAPDVLVLDWVMPGMTGIDVCAFVRSSPSQFRNLGILLLTGTRSAEEVVQALSAGANDFLAKPYFEPELRARVHALMRTRRLMHQLERSEARFRTLLAKSPDPLLAVDRAGHITFANDEAASLFSASVAQLIGRSARELLPDFRPEAAPENEGTHLLPDARIGERVVAPTVKWAGPAKDLAATIAIRDVTESRREQDRRLDFYSTVAHDLRSPLNAISLRCSLMQRGKHGLLSPGVLEDIRRIEKAVESLVALVNDFLDLARLEGAGLKLELAPVPVVELISGIVEELAPLAEAGQLLLAFKPPRQPLKVLGDKRRLVQVLSNLLANALKFTPPGGRVEVIIAMRAGSIEVGVSDTGPGIPEEALPHIFDRFTRAENTDKVAGSGLGLMIVRQVIEAHGGAVWVDSRLGEGTTFWFRLKHHTAEAAAPTALAAGD